MSDDRELWAKFKEEVEERNEKIRLKYEIQALKEQLAQKNKNNLINKLKSLFKALKNTIDRTSS